MWTKYRLASQSGQVVKNSQNEAQKSLNEKNQVRLQQKEGMEELVLEDFSAQEKEKTKKCDVKDLSDIWFEFCHDKGTVAPNDYPQHGE